MSKAQAHTKATARDCILKHLVTHPDGSTLNDIAKTAQQHGYGFSRRSVENALRAMSQADEVMRVAIGGRGKDMRTLLYTAPEHAQALVRASMGVKNIAVEHQKRVRAATFHDTEARITSETKVTIAPPFVDRRFVAVTAPSVIDSAQCREWARGCA